MSNKQSTFVDKLISLVPVWGYHHGQSEGFKRGMIEISQKYEEIFKTFRNELLQVERDVFGKENCFITPEGWDKEYWCNSLKYFLNGNTVSLSAREILFAFIKAFLEKMDEKNMKSIKGAPMTYSCLAMAQCAISTDMEKLLELDKSFLEIAMDFLVLFSPLEYDNNYKELAAEISTLRNEISAMLSDSSSCKILAIGRTGVGKSSLLNYLLGKELFVAASGKPQTMGFDEATGIVNNIKVTIYDSRGLETGDESYDYEEFKCELNKFKQKHDVFQAPYDWLHASIYCMPKRFQPVDCEIINECLEDNFNVIVALTKMDGLEQEKIQNIIDQLKNDCPRLKPENIIPVCSVDKVDREGNVVKPFGRDELIKASCAAFKDTILQYLPRRCIILAQAEIDNFKSGMKSRIESRDMAWFFNNEDVEWFKNEIKDFQQDFCKRILPEIINREMSEVVKSFTKAVSCYIEKSTPQVYYDEILSAALVKTFGAQLGGALATAIIRNVGISVGGKLAAKSALTAALGTSIVLPGINILLAVFSTIWIAIDLWGKNDKLRQEFNKVLDNVTEELKKNLIPVEEEIRKNLNTAVNN